VIDPERILRELDGLWSSLGRKDDGSAGVLRACSMTFLVITADADGAGPVGQTLALLMKDHPSRAIVLRLVEGAPRLDARVVAQCWMPFGRRQQICCEQIEIALAPDMLASSASLLRALIAPDLPVALWCRPAALIGDAALEEVFDLAGKVIVDTALAPDPGAAIEAVRRARASGRVAGDLAWTRLTRWRETFAQVFANPLHAARLGSVRGAVIEYAGETAPATARYLGAWLARALQGIAIEERRAGRGRPKLTAVRLNGGGLAMSVAVGEDRSVELTVDGMTSHTSFPVLGDYELLREELAILGPDRVYDQALEAVR
jgi:glucose-6-phosphate dehydrogenase assembly protein OpcA